MNEYDFDILRLGGQGFCCAQIVVLLGLEMQGVENPGLVRAMSGLCNGCASRHCTCGVLTGGACLLAYHAGKGTPGEQASDNLPLMLEELSDWFSGYAGEHFGGITCDAIVPDGKPDQSRCGSLLSECYGQILRILVDNGFDPGSVHE